MNPNSAMNDDAASPVSARPLHIVLGVSGSVAAVKGPALAAQLAATLRARVRVVLTRGGRGFYDADDDRCPAAAYDEEAWHRAKEMTIRDDEDERAPSIRIFEPTDDWTAWKALGDPVLHIDLRRWADVLLVAPLSAHTLAKFANGLCDDLLSCTVRAWDFSDRSKLLLLAPAMNAHMWDHPITRRQLDAIVGFSSSSRVKILSPQVKELACGEVGNGALASVENIVSAVQEAAVQIEGKKEDIAR